MKTDTELKDLAEPIVDIYNNIAHDLLVKIASFFSYDENLTIKNSLDWYFAKLQEMGTLNSEAIRIISKYSEVSEKKIQKALKEAGYGSISKDRVGFLVGKGATDISFEKLLFSKTIKSTLDTSYMDTKDVFKMINTKAVESTKKAYMDSLNQARLEIGTGVYDSNTAITRAIEKMIDKGIKGATYKRKDGTTYQMSLESVVRRDMLTAINQAYNKGAEEIAKKLGAEYYEVSSHLGARLGDGKNPISNHFNWQGKIYKINGSNEKYDNFYEKTGYGDILGLGGVNCRHRIRAFFPGIDKPMEEQYSYEDNKKAVDLQNKQRSYERKIRNYRTKQDVFKQLGNKEDYLKWKNKEQQIFPEYTNFLKENNLHRDYARERVVKKNIDINQENNKITTKGIFEDNLINRDFKKLDNKVENLIIYDANSKKKKVIETSDSRNSVGGLKSLFIMKTSKKNSLVAAHNHPSNTSFSLKDLETFNKFESLSTIIVKTDDYLYYLEKNGISKINEKELGKYIRKIRNSYELVYGKTNKAFHLTNVEISKKIGWKYGRTKER